MQRVVRSAALAACALIVSGVSLGIASARSSAQDAAKPAAAQAADAKSAVVIPFFGNEKCPITGKAVNQTKYVESDGQRAYYCCNTCLGKAKADPKAAIAAAYKEPKAVGNKNCPVSGHAIDAAKGKEVVWQGQKVMLCCGDCVAAFNKTPMLFVTAAVYGAEDMKNKNCPVMKVNEGKDDESDPSILAVYKGKIVHLCCSDCIPAFVKEPDKFMAALAAKK